MSETDIDEDTLIQKLGQKLTSGTDESDETTDDGSTDAGQKGDAETPDEAGQKQPEDGDGGDTDAVDELVAALADEMGVEASEVMDALGQVGQNAGGHDDEEEDDEEEMEGMKTDAAPDGVITEDDLGEKLSELGVVTEDDLGEKLDDHREAIVDDLGQKLTETNKEAVEEIAQKMTTGSTPNPAGGSIQDGEDFASHLEDIADGEGW